MLVSAFRLLVIVAVLLVFRFAADVDAEGAVELLVGFGDDHREEGVAAAQQLGAVDELGGERVGGRADGQRQKRLVRVQARVARVQVLGLEVADGLDHLVGDDVDVLDARHALEGVHQQRRGGAEQVGRLARHDRAVGEHHGARGAAGRLLLEQCGAAGGGVVGVDAGLVHHQLQLAEAILADAGALDLDGGLEVAAHDLHLCGVAHRVVVHDRHARHVDAHVGGGLVGALAHDLLHHGLEHGEDLDVAVVVDGGLAVGLQMERVDGVHVVQIDRRGLVGDVDRVLQRQVPDGERLELGVAGLGAALVLVVELREAGRHLARAGAGRGHDHQRTAGLDELVFAVALVADDVLDVVGVAGDGVVQTALDAERVEAAAERVGVGLAGVLRDDHVADEEAHAAEHVHQAQQVVIVGDAQIAARLALLDIVGVDARDDLDVVDEALEHADLGVRLEARQHARGVVVVEELAAEFQVELAAELGDALLDAFGLQ